MKKWILPAVCIVCVLAVAFMIFALTIGNKQSNKGFIPPTLDQSAISGTPTVPDDMGYSEIYSDGMSYKAWVCGKVRVNHNSADIYFTSDKDNDCLLKLRVLDENDNIIAETGLINPNEYIKTITFDDTVQDGQTIQLKIMGYEKDTYYSTGAVTLSTTVMKGE